MRVEFTHSARRHKMGKAHDRQGLANPLVVESIVQEQDGILVAIHARDLRPKFRARDEEGKRS